MSERTLHAARADEAGGSDQLREVLAAARWLIEMDRENERQTFASRLAARRLEIALEAYETNAPRSEWGGAIGCAAIVIAVIVALIAGGAVALGWLA